MNFNFKINSTSKYVIIRIISNPTSLPDTSIVFNTIGLQLYFLRPGENNVLITLQALETPALNDPWLSGGFIHIGSGYYLLCVPNEALVEGCDSVLIHGVCPDKTIIGANIKLESKIVSDLNDLSSANVTAAVPSVDDFISGKSNNVVDNDGTNNITEIQILRTIMRYILGNKSITNGVHNFSKLNGSPGAIVATISGDETSGSRTLNSKDLT